jgi:hypothetical protein
MSAPTFITSGTARFDFNSRVASSHRVRCQLIVVVTGEEGREFGYEDHWDDEGVFHYFGAGQEGDMEFVRGNRAFR